MYRIGNPFWKTIARFGVPLTLRINVSHDNEAGVFVATSNDLRGLVAEAESMDVLVVELRCAIDDLLTLQLNAKPPSPPVADLRLCPA